MLSTRPAARWLAFLAGLTLAFLFAGVSIAKRMGYRINTTPSVPAGIWRVLPLPARPARGQIVSICPPPTAAFIEARARGYLSHGRCPGGLEPMLKPVAAIAGDAVEQTPSGLVLNGKALPDTVALAADSSGRPLRRLQGSRLVIAADEAFLLSTMNGRSFDSRYFGPLPVTAIEGLAVPVWVAADRRELASRAD